MATLKNGMKVVLLTLFVVCAFTTLPALSQEINLQDCRVVELTNEERHTFEDLREGGLPLQPPGPLEAGPFESEPGGVPPVELSPLSCESGPKMVLHSVGPSYFHHPPIQKGVCDGLRCTTPPCFARSSAKRSVCVHTWKFSGGSWMYIGPKLVFYTDQLKCGCKQCSDIGTREECLRYEKSCPNSFIKGSFCFWRCRRLTPIELESPLEVARGPVIDLEPSLLLPCCDCCSIVCRPPFVLDRKMCRCVCPPGSFQNFYTGDCIGTCEKVKDLDQCGMVNCIDNQHFKCRVDGKKCVCPTCSDISEKDCARCSRTKCIEQPNKPKCVVDLETNRCRCPNCEDENQEELCAKIMCNGIPLGRPCSWDSRNQQCRCRFRG